VMRLWSVSFIVLYLWQPTLHRVGVRGVRPARPAGALVPEFGTVDVVAVGHDPPHPLAAIRAMPVEPRIEESGHVSAPRPFQFLPEAFGHHVGVVSISLIDAAPIPVQERP